MARNEETYPLKVLSLVSYLENVHLPALSLKDVIFLLVVDSLCFKTFCDENFIPCANLAFWLATSRWQISASSSLPVNFVSGQRDDTHLICFIVWFLVLLSSKAIKLIIYFKSHASQGSASAR